MASSPAPATPGAPSRRWAVNRSATLPTTLLTNTPRAGANVEIGATEGVETLYTHPNASVIKFTTSTSARPSPAAGSPASASLLPWASPRESIIAAGPLEIYRVPGSVSFLSSGALLHAILPRSQCWCVDGVSKFAMRVLADTYYRIELPGSSQEDMQKVEQLKATLQKVLFYERSACPFSRTFSLDLPEMPDVKTRRRRADGPAKKWKLDRAFSWKPQDGAQPMGASSSGDEGSSGSVSSVASEDESDITASPSKQKLASLANKNLASKEMVEPVSELNFRPATRTSSAPVVRSATAPTQTFAGMNGRQIATGVNVDGAVEVIENVEAAHRSSAENTTQLPVLSGSRRLQAFPTDMPPSPPDSSAGLETDEQRAQTNIFESTRAAEEETEAPSEVVSSTTWPATAHNRDADSKAQHMLDSEIHLTEETQEYMREIVRQDDEEVVDSSLPAARVAIPIDVSPEVFEGKAAVEVATTSPSSVIVDAESSMVENRPAASEDPYAAIQARIQARRSIGGTTSFHPANTTTFRSSTCSASSSGTITSNRSSISLASSSSSSKHQQALATAMVRKACSVFLGPPAHLVALMLRIAARFTNATFGVESMFYVSTPARTPRRVPGSFNMSGDLSSDDGESLSDEDDFGVPIRSPVRLAQRTGHDHDVQSLSIDG